MNQAAEFLLAAKLPVQTTPGVAARGWWRIRGRRFLWRARTKGHLIRRSDTFPKRRRTGQRGGAIPGSGRRSCRRWGGGFGGGMARSGSATGNHPTRSGWRGAAVPTRSRQGGGGGGILPVDFLERLLGRRPGPITRTILRARAAAGFITEGHAGGEAFQFDGQFRKPANLGE